MFVLGYLCLYECTFISIAMWLSWCFDCGDLGIDLCFATCVYFLRLGVEAAVQFMYFSAYIIPAHYLQIPQSPSRNVALAHLISSQQSIIPYGVK